MIEHEDYRTLYDDHVDYRDRRDPTSHAAAEIRLETREFKVPNLLKVLPSDTPLTTIIEIGCATGEVLAEFPDHWDGNNEKIHKIGFDISPLNIAAAKSRYPEITFFDSDFSQYSGMADVVVLSDVLEHVPDDIDFLRRASALAPLVLINLPLENNWTNRDRNYGIDDVSGHLRSYSLEDGISIVEGAGLHVKKWFRVWVHETDYDLHRRDLRRRHCGSAHNGPMLVRALKTATYFSARAIRPFGRRLFSSNLFLCATR